MKQKHFISCLCVCLFSTAFITAQVVSKFQVKNQFAGYFQQQQQNWLVKQLPFNSVTYRFTNKLVLPATLNKPLLYQQKIVKPVQPALPVFYSVAKKPQVPITYYSYLLQERTEYIKWQKQSWWRDPQKAPGADLLRNYFYHSW